MGGRGRLGGSEYWAHTRSRAVERDGSSAMGISFFTWTWGNSGWDMFSTTVGIAANAHNNKPELEKRHSRDYLSMHMSIGELIKMCKRCYMAIKYLPVEGVGGVSSLGMA